jgi:deazaflavin-dependent oxidoreductase (nitroreductase family)
MSSNRTPTDWQRMNDAVIEEFRANGGQVGGRFAGRPMLLLTTIGARSGQPRVTPLNYSTDGDRLVVIASKGGSPTHPDWYRNLVANPEVTIEVGTERFRARAMTAQEPERTRLFDQQAAIMPFFDGYRRQVTAREIPVVVFERVEGAAP